MKCLLMVLAMSVALRYDDAEPKVADLIAQLGNEDVSVRDRAETQLLQLGEKALPALKAHESKDSEVKARSRSIVRRISWSKAELKWSRFAAEHMDRMRSRHAGSLHAKLPGHEFKMAWRVVESPILKTRFPNYRFRFDTRFLFGLRKDGHIVCLGLDWPLRKPFKSAPDFELKKFPAFLKDSSFRVKKNADAVEAVRLGYLLHVEYDYGYRRMWPFQEKWKRHLKSWKYHVTRDGSTWKVTNEYVGPSGPKLRPSQWKFDVAKDGRVIGVKRSKI